MVTFNVDSLDFEDDEEARFGTDSDFATRFDSANDRLEVADIANGTVSHIPRGTGTDLIGGKFAETVAEGKALADDGNVYDTIQGAVDNASSWVKVGAGTFHESVTIDTAGLTLEGSGERTKIQSSVSGILVQSTDVTICDLSVYAGSGYGIRVESPNCVIKNISVKSNEDRAIQVIRENNTIKNCNIVGGSHAVILNRGGIMVENIVLGTNKFEGIRINDDDAVVSNNIVKNVNTISILCDGNDSIVTGNIVTGSRYGIQINGGFIDNIVSKNRIYDTTGSNIKDFGTGTVLDSNLTT